MRNVYLLRAFAVVAALAMAVGFVRGRADSPVPWVEIYALALAWAALAAAWLRPRTTATPLPRVEWLVFAAVLIWRLATLTHVSLWGDEDWQAWTALVDRPVRAGWQNHQPPLDMAFMAVTQRLFPNSLIALRAPAALASALGAMLVFRLGWRLLRSQPGALVLTAIYVGHRYIVQYGYEARPISLGLFAFLLAVELMEARFAHGFAAWMLALLALGLQPPFALASLALALLVAMRAPRLWLRTLAPAGLALALFVPLQLQIIRHAPPRLGKLAHASPAVIAAAVRSPETWHIPREHYFDALLLPLAFVALVCLLRHRRLRPLLDASAPALAGLVYLVVVSVFFAIGVEWWLQPYYLIFAWPLILLGMAAIAARVELPWRHATVLLVLVPLVANAWLRKVPLWGKPTERADVADAYRAVREGPRPAALTSLCLAHDGDFCPDPPTAVRFYLPRGGPVDHPDMGDTDDWTERFFMARGEPRRLALAYNLYFPGEPLPEVALPAGVALRRFPGVVLITVDGPDLERRAVDLLEAYREAYVKEQHKRPDQLYPLLIWGHLGLGERARALELWHELGPAPENDSLWQKRDSIRAQLGDP